MKCLEVFREGSLAEVSNKLHLYRRRVKGRVFTADPTQSNAL